MCDVIPPDLYIQPSRQKDQDADKQPGNITHKHKTLPLRVLLKTVMYVKTLSMERYRKATDVTDSRREGERQKNRERERIREGKKKRNRESKR